MNNNKHNISLIVDKYTNLFYSSINKTINSLKLILFINKFIHKLIVFNKKFLLNISKSNNYTILLKQFNKLLIKITQILDKTHSINIIINRMRYPNILIKNKLIIRVGNLNNILIYITNLKKIKITLTDKNYLINLSSKNLCYLKNLASLIKCIRKIDRCTGIGMNYEMEKIIFKRKIVNDSKQK